MGQSEHWLFWNPNIHYLLEPSVLLRLLLGIASLLELLPYFLFFTFRVLSVWSINAMSSLLSFRLCYVRFCVGFNLQK
jgi:hypothetical protein